MHLTGSSFVFLKQVDSTNNYAMAKVHAGLAKHGDAYFSSNQTGGKGQRGKVWITGVDENIALSVIISPKSLNLTHPFQLSVITALASLDFFRKYAGDETHIKWPNDVYWRDRKAGGILIENKFNGPEWRWAVIGTGININQARFDPALTNPVSLLQITGKKFDLLSLAKELHNLILKRSNELLTKSYEMMLAEYNRNLYKIHQLVRLKKDNMIFETIVNGISPHGQLLTGEAFLKSFDFGEVQWVM